MPTPTALIEAAIIASWLIATPSEADPASSSAPCNLHTAVWVWSYWNGDETNSHSYLKSSMDPTDSEGKNPNFLAQDAIPCMI